MTPLLGSGAPAQRKGGCRSASDFVSHLIAFDSHRWRCAQKDTAGWIFGPCFRAEREPFGHTRRLEPQPRGAVTRRAVAQRRSRAGGLTRLSAEAISDSAWTGLQNWPHGVSRRETRIVRSLFVRDSSHGHESGLKMACRKGSNPARKGR